MLFSIMQCVVLNSIFSNQELFKPG